ncbi:MAG: non-heme iron oxygenase ferredoxin subunit [Candidatus Thiodiazotropha sp.]
MTGEWIEVARVGELPPGGMKRIEIDGHRFLLANANGCYYAVDERCSHEDVSLYLGCIQGDHIKCSLHGSRFSLKSGDPLEDPATDPIGCYAVKLEGEKILIKPHTLNVS